MPSSVSVNACGFAIMLQQVSALACLGVHGCGGFLGDEEYYFLQSWSCGSVMAKSRAMWMDDSEMVRRGDRYIRSGTELVG